MEMSALKPAGKGAYHGKLMSVMAETSQSAMGPYFARAEVGFSLYSSTAYMRVYLSVKA